MAHNNYVILLRDPRTLALKGILGQFQAATWTRRTLRKGEFTIHTHTEQLDALTLIDPGTVVEIRRDGAFEFAGVCTRQEYDAPTGIWKLTGADLKGFHLANRVTDPGVSEFDAQIAVGIKERGSVAEFVAHACRAIENPEAYPMLFKAVIDRIWPAIAQFDVTSRTDGESEEASADRWSRLAEDYDRRVEKAEATTVEPEPERSGGEGA